MGKPSRQKGLRRENQIVQMLKEDGLEAERISAPYKSGPDLYIYAPDSIMLRGVVKGRKNGDGWKTIKRWMGDPRVDALFLVEDRCDPIVVSPFNVWRRLIQAGETRDGPN